MNAGFIERVLAALPPQVREISSRLLDAGHASYLVGGSLRDLLLGRPVTDWDLATDARPEEVLRLFPGSLTIGLAHGTVTVMRGDAAFEVTTLRRESAYSDARRPDAVIFVGDILEDLARRDFTVNAIAFDLLAGSVVDPHGGMRDLERRAIRAVGEPRARFLEDALRPMRAARLACQMGFEIEPATMEALADEDVHERFGLLAMERVRDELVKILVSPKPSIGLEVLRESGLLRLVLPELDSCVAAPQNEYHRLDVYDHALASVDAAPAEKAVVRLAALFHDLGKPATREVRGARVTFHGHEMRGAEIAEAALARLRFSNETKERVVHLVRHHMFHYHAGWSDAAVRRFVRRVGVESVADLFDLRIADVIGKGMGGSLVPLEELRRKISAEMDRGVAFSVRGLAVTGDDVMRACGLAPGRVVGRVLDRLLERVLADPNLNRRDELLSMAREAADELGCPPGGRAGGSPGTATGAQGK